MNTDQIPIVNSTHLDGGLRRKLSELYKYYLTCLTNLAASESQPTEQLGNWNIEDVFPSRIERELANLTGNGIFMDDMSIALVEEAIERKWKQMQYTIESGKDRNEVLSQAVYLSMSLYEQFNDLFLRICRSRLLLSSSTYINTTGSWSKMGMYKAEPKDGSAFAA